MHFDYYGLYLQLFFFIILYGLYSSVSVYAFVLTLLIFVIWYGIFFAYLDLDLFSALVFMVEFLVFFIILLFSFFSNTWLVKNIFKNKNNNIWVYSLYLFIVYNVINYYINFNNYYYNDIDFFSLVDDIFQSDFYIFYVILYIQNLFFIIFSFLFFTYISVLILYLIKLFNYGNFNRIIRHQKLNKQVFRLGAIKSFKRGCYKRERFLYPPI